MWALQLMSELSAERFETMEDLRVHTYALGALAGRAPQESRTLVKTLWMLSGKPTPVSLPEDRPQVETASEVHL